jgi:uncharacterized protein (DUF427 family)
VTARHPDGSARSRSGYLWTVRAGGVEAADVVWGYGTPLPESITVAGLVAFWPERSAELEVYVDGQRVGQG